MPTRTRIRCSGDTVIIAPEARTARAANSAEPAQIRSPRACSNAMGMRCRHPHLRMSLSLSGQCKRHDYTRTTRPRCQLFSVAPHCWDESFSCRARHHASIQSLPCTLCHLPSKSFRSNQERAHRRCSRPPRPSLLASRRLLAQYDLERSHVRTAIALR